jgi:hypothetical protein
MKIAKARELIGEFEELEDKEAEIGAARAVIAALGPAAKEDWAIRLQYLGEEDLDFTFRENNNKIHDEIVGLLDATLSKVAARRLIKRREISDECQYVEPPEEPVEP